MLHIKHLQKIQTLTIRISYVWRPVSTCCACSRRIENVTIEPEAENASVRHFAQVERGSRCR